MVCLITAERATGSVRWLVGSTAARAKTRRVGSVLVVLPGTFVGELKLARRAILAVVSVECWHCEACARHARLRSAVVRVCSRPF